MVTKGMNENTQIIDTTTETRHKLLLIGQASQEFLILLQVLLRKFCNDLTLKLNKASSYSVTKATVNCHVSRAVATMEIFGQSLTHVGVLM